MKAAINPTNTSSKKKKVSRNSSASILNVSGPKISPFENPALNQFLHSLKSVPVGSSGSTSSGGYTSPNLKGYVPDFSSEQRLALAHADITPEQAVTSQKVLDILKEVEGQNQRIIAAGGQPEDTSHRHGLLNRVLDVIQRPMYAMAEGARETAEAATSGEGFVNSLEAFGHGALQGIEGKKKTDFIQVLQEAQDVRSAKDAGMSGKEAVDFALLHPGSSGEIGTGQKIAGFGLDVLGDPLTYTGIGLVSKGAKAVELAEDASKALSTIKAAERLSPEARDLITGAHFASGKISKKAAVSAEGRVRNIAHALAKAEGSAKYDKVLGEALKHESLAGIDEFHAVNDREILHLARTAKANREQEVMSNILEKYNAVTAEAVNRHIALKLPGVKVALPGIPNVDLLAAATKGALTRVDPVAKGMRVFSKRFQTVAKAFPELHEAKLQAFDFGMTRVRLRGRELRMRLNPLGKNGRTESWTAFLNGHASNQLVKLPDGSTIDAAEWIKNRVNPIKLSTLEHGWEPSDFKPWLPQGLELKITKIVRDGKKVDDPEWLLNSLKDWNIKDGGKALWFLESAFEQTSAYKSMLGSMGDTFGITLTETHTPQQLSLFNGLKDKGWVAPKGVPELSGHLFPEETANYVSQISHLMKDEKNWSGFMRRWAKIQQPIKFLLTLPNPSFHMHNAFGDAFINNLDNVSPWSYIQSAKLMSHRSKWFEQFKKEENLHPLLFEEGEPLKLARQTVGPDDKKFIKNSMRLRSADGTTYNHLSQAEIYAGYNKFGLRQNYATDLGFTESSPTGMLRGMVDKITSASEAREDYFRMAHFIDLIKTNPSKARTLEDAMNYAARRVRQTHFDYTDFTKFEKEVMSQVIPFYKWTRKALPLMAQIMVTDPGKAALIPKALRAMSALTGNIDMETNDTLPNLQNAIVPKWMMESGYVPVGDWFGDGNQSFGYIPNPFTDFFTQQFSGVSQGSNADGGIIRKLVNDVFGSASPLVKIPYELQSNQSLFTGAKVIRDDPGAPSKVDQLLNYLASQIPATNVTNQYVRKGRVDTGFNWLTGLSIHDNDEARQIGELLRQRDVGRAIERILRYKNGGTLPGSTGSGFSGRGF